VSIGDLLLQLGDPLRCYDGLRRGDRLGAERAADQNDTKEEAPFANISNADG